jgi:hypothetical protein
MTYPLTTTLNRIYACRPCSDGWAAGLEAAGKTEPDDEVLTYAQIATSVDLKDALWCCRAELQYSKEWRLFAVWCARQVQHLMKDRRSIDALDVAERFVNNKATEKELATAWSAAADAWAATAAAAARADAAWAATDAAAAARADAAADAAWAAADAAWSAAAAAADAARADARADARDAQKSAFIQLVTTGTLP